MTDNEQDLIKAALEWQEHDLSTEHYTFNAFRRAVGIVAADRLPDEVRDALLTLARARQDLPKGLPNNVYNCAVGMAEAYVAAEQEQFDESVPE